MAAVVRCSRYAASRPAKPAKQRRLEQHSRTAATEVFEPMFVVFARAGGAGVRAVCDAAACERERAVRGLPLRTGARAAVRRVPTSDGSIAFVSFYNSSISTSLSRVSSLSTIELSPDRPNT